MAPDTLEAPSSMVLYEVADGIATITLNRPAVLNAFCPEMARAFLRALDRTDSDDAVRAVIVTGSGRAFCAGADLSEAQAAFEHDQLTDDRSEVFRDLGGIMTLRIFDSLKPIIAAINGPAVGIGCTLTLAMDCRIASAPARFGFAFARRGIIPEAASSWFLPRIVGVTTALDWCFSGRVFPAQEALEKGLVSKVVEPESLLDAAKSTARRFTEASAPVSVALTRRMIWRMLTADHPMAAHRADSRALELLGSAPDTAEGVASFLEKRPANFTGRVSTDLPDIFPDWRNPDFAC